MARRASEQLTPLELETIEVLWERGPSTVGEVQAGMQGEPAYTTVQTMLNILERKGRAKRVLRGKAYVYRAAVSREKARGGAVRDLLERMFGGSSEALVLSLVETEGIDAEQLERLAKKVAEAERRERGAGTAVEPAAGGAVKGGQGEGR